MLPSSSKPLLNINNYLRNFGFSVRQIIRLTRAATYFHPALVLEAFGAGVRRMTEGAQNPPPPAGDLRNLCAGGRQWTRGD